MSTPPDDDDTPPRRDPAEPDPTAAEPRDPDADAILARRRAFVVSALAGLGAAATAPLDALADGESVGGGYIAQPRPCLRRVPMPCLSPMPRYGYLRVTATPPGAVTVDGTARGTTPLTIALLPGAHVVVVTDPASGASRTMNVDIALRQTKDITVRLTP